MIKSLRGKPHSCEKGTQSSGDTLQPEHWRRIYRRSIPPYRAGLVKTERGKKARFAAAVITCNNSLSSAPVSSLGNNQLPEQNRGEDAER